MLIRALTLWRPWPFAILRATPRKRFEARPWLPSAKQLPLGSWLAIHAGAKWDLEGYAAIREIDPTIPTEGDHPRGLVGVVEYRGAFERGRTYVGGTRPAELQAEIPKDDPYDALLARFGQFAWVFGEVVAFEAPIDVPGEQGLWKVPERFYRQIGEAIRMAPA